MTCATIKDLVDVYLLWAQRRYRKHGRISRQYQNLSAMLTHLLAVVVPAERLLDRAATCPETGARALRDVPPGEFSIADFEDYLDHLCHLKGRGDEPIAVSTVNKYRGWTLQFFGWAAKERQGYIEPAVHFRLKQVEEVEPGRTPARRTAKIKSAKEEHVRELIQFCRKHAAELPVRTPHQRQRRRRWQLLALALEVHWESGMRPGELVQMRQCDLSVERDNEGEVWWLYTAPTFKTEHHAGEERTIYLNAIAQMALGEAIELNRYDGPQQMFDWAHGFDDTMRIWPWKASDPDAARNGYYGAVTNALKMAKIPHCAPNQIRHAFATRAAAVDLEGARAQLGHRNIKTTEGYLDRDGQAARKLLDRL
ncbi:site-specific integrase [Planctomycetales bacterium ZRK34]|nr:site-specific integrase [Planctomycetales bacterium ZRK34]